MRIATQDVQNLGLGLRQIACTDIRTDIIVRFPRNLIIANMQVSILELMVFPQQQVAEKQRQETSILIDARVDAGIVRAREHIAETDCGLPNAPPLTALGLSLADLILEIVVCAAHVDRHSQTKPLARLRHGTMSLITSQNVTAPKPSGRVRTRPGRAQAAFIALYRAAMVKSAYRQSPSPC